MKKKIVHIVLSMEIGGLEVLVFKIIKRQISSENVDVELICLDQRGSLADYAEKIGIKVHLINRKPGLLDIEALRKLRNIINIIQPNIVHSHNQESSYYAVLGTLLNVNATRIHTQHGIEPPLNYKRILKTGIVSIFLTKFVAVSMDIYKQYVNRLRILKRKSIVVINGVDTEEYVYSPEDDKELRTRERLGTSKVIICVARLHNIKNHMMTIDVFDDVYKHDKSVLLLLVGDGPEKSNIEHHIDSVESKNNILVLGARMDVKNLLSTAECFLLTSKSEGINVSILEAMSTGVPVVAMNVGGNSEIIEDGKNGYLIDKMDRKKTALKVLEIVENRELRNRLSVKAREKIINKFSFDEMYREYQKLYELE